MPKSRTRKKTKHALGGGDPRRRSRNTLARFLTAGKQDARKWRAKACERRTAENLCECADDIRVFESAAELEAADRSPAHCSHCGRERLVVSIVNPTLAEILRSAPPEKVRQHLSTLESLGK